MTGDRPKSEIVAWIAAVAVLVFVAWKLVAPGGGSAAGGAPVACSAGSPGGSRAGLALHVAGRVRRPGLYTLRTGARIATAIARAGGAAWRRPLGREPGDEGAGRSAGAGAATGRAAQPGGSGGRAGGSGGGRRISLTTATVEQLDQLDGVGPTLAKRIVDYREEHGGFRSVDELKQVDGIGEKRFAALEASVGPVSWLARRPWHLAMGALAAGSPARASREPLPRRRPSRPASGWGSAVRASPSCVPDWPSSGRTSGRRGSPPSSARARTSATRAGRRRSGGAGTTPRGPVPGGRERCSCVAAEGIARVVGGFPRGSRERRRPIPGRFCPFGAASRACVAAMASGATCVAAESPASSKSRTRGPPGGAPGSQGLLDGLRRRRAQGVGAGLASEELGTASRDGPGAGRGHPARGARGLAPVGPSPTSWQ